jgi:hypothetical protein
MAFLFIAMVFEGLPQSSESPASAILGNDL